MVQQLTHADRAAMKDLVADAERIDRELASTVQCPVCPAVPGEPCEGAGVWDPGSRHQHSVACHIGRLKRAVPVPRPPQYAWLDIHDEILADPWGFWAR